jgi:type VI protein secretion system component Hcp
MSFVTLLEKLAWGTGRRYPTRLRPTLEALEDRIQPSAATTITHIALQLPGLQDEPAKGFAVDSLQGGETYSAVGQSHYDPFQVVLSVNQSTASLSSAAIQGTLFQDGDLTVSTMSNEAYLTFELTDAVISSVHFLRNSSRPKVEVDLVFNGLTTDGLVAGNTLLQPLPEQPLTGINLLLHQHKNATPIEVSLQSVTVAETFDLGQTPRLDEFQATMFVDRETPLLKMAAERGTLFANAGLTLETGNNVQAETLQLSRVVLTSFQFEGDTTDRAEASFGFLAESLVASVPNIGNEI